MKVFRILGLTLLGIVALLFALVVIATLVIDPNNYKPQIERAVEDATRLDLNLGGDIDWSLFPLGLTLNDVNADLDGELLARLDNLTAQVDLWSLLRFEPRVDTFILEGMTANLVRNEQGEGNWERIMRESPDQPTDPAAAETPEGESGEPSQPLQFEIDEVRIADAELRLTDQASGQELVLDRVNLVSENISLGTTFPFELDFHLATSQPPLDVEGSVTAAVNFSEDLKRFVIKDLESQYQIAGEPVGGKTVEAALSGDIELDLAAETASLADLRAQIANLVLRSDVNIKGFGDTPQINGNLAIEPFSARELLATLGQPAIETQDPDALQQIGLETDIAGPAGQLELNNLILTLDQTQFKGTGRYGFADSAIKLNLQGNKLNLDRYLPPPSENEDAPAAADAQGDARTASVAEDAENAETPETDLLPLETLRGLVFDVRVGLDELIAKNLTISDVEVRSAGQNGLITVDPVKAQLYGGDALLTARLDARSDTPKWQISQRLNNIETLPLLKDLAELELVSGKINLRADVTTAGNRVTSLRENADGNASFTMADGAFESVNLTSYACQGIALANGETIDTSTWPARTKFEDLSAVMQIDGNVLDNNNLSAALGGLDLDGEGTVDLARMMLDYELGLRVVGAVHENNACRVNERIMNIAIPLECRGSLEDPGSLCSFDGSRFRDALKDVAKADVQRKANKEIDRAVDKQLDKVLGGEEDSGTRKQIKDAVKGLFNR